MFSGVVVMVFGKSVSKKAKVFGVTLLLLAMSGGGLLLEGLLLEKLNHL